MKCSEHGVEMQEVCGDFVCGRCYEAAMMAQPIRDIVAQRPKGFGSEYVPYVPKAGAYSGKASKAGEPNRVPFTQR